MITFFNVPLAAETITDDASEGGNDGNQKELGKEQEVERCDGEKHREPRGGEEAERSGAGERGEAPGRTLSAGEQPTIKGTTFPIKEG